MCGSGSGVAAVTIAVDRETADASRGLKWLRETVTYTCVPYVYNWSQGVEKCTLDLVLSSSTRANTIQTTVLASKECPKFLLEPLNLPPLLDLYETTPLTPENLAQNTPLQVQHDLTLSSPLLHALKVFEFCWS